MLLMVILLQAEMSKSLSDEVFECSLCTWAEDCASSSAAADAKSVLWGLGWG